MILIILFAKFWNIYSKATSGTGGSFQTNIILIGLVT